MGTGWGGGGGVGGGEGMELICRSDLHRRERRKSIFEGPLYSCIGACKNNNNNKQNSKKTEVRPMQINVAYLKYRSYTSSAVL